MENIPQVAAQFGIENLPVHFISHDFSQILLPSPSTEDRVALISISDTLKLELAILADTSGSITISQQHCQNTYGFTPPRPTLDEWRKKLRAFQKKQPNTVPTVEIFSSPLHKRGAPSLLGPVLESSLIYFLTEARAAESCVNAAIIVTVAYGLFLYNNPTLLPQFGGHVSLTTNWAKQWLSRRNWVKRRATTGHRHIPDDFQHQKDEFLKKVNNIILTHNIPSHLVVNFNQTGLNLVPTSNWTMSPQSADQVAIAHKGDKRQITGVMAGSVHGDVLPPPRYC
jgi:hypothetical protein